MVDEIEESNRIPDNFEHSMQTENEVEIGNENERLLPRLNDTETIKQYFQEDSEIATYSRYIDNNKDPGNIRILILNPYRCRPFNKKKYIC